MFPLNLSRLSVAVLLVASILPVWAAVRHHTFLNDDTYITLTYAKNLAHGQGFVYNGGPPTLGTTTPLLTLIVAGLTTLLPAAEVATIAVFFTAACWIATAWTFVLFRHAWKLTMWQAAIVGLVLVASGGVTTLGMEAHLFALLLVLSLSLFQAKRYGATGVATGLLFLTRGEGVLVLGVLVATQLVWLWTHKQRVSMATLTAVLHIMLGFVLPVSVWCIYAYTTFGYVLPNTLAAKQAQAQTLAWLPFSQRLFKEWIPTWGQQFAPDALPFLNGWWLLVIVGVYSILIKQQRWMPFLGWIVAFVSGYTLLGVSGYWWYQLPILFVLSLCFALGVLAGVDLLMRARRFRTIRQGLAISLVTASIAVLSMPTISAVRTNTGDPRAHSYLALSRWVQDRISPDESIAFVEIGYFGYYTNNRIIDLAGLIHPESVPHIAQGDFAWTFWHFEPDYYVYLPDFDWALASIQADPRLAQHYEPIATLPGPRTTDFVVYKRRDQATSEHQVKNNEASP